MFTRRKFSVGTGAVLLAGVDIARAQSEGKIIVGQSAAFTGPAAQLGIQFHQDAQLFFDQLDAQGGIGLQQIEMRMLDDGYEPARCAENIAKLIADKVFALFGYIRHADRHRRAAAGHQGQNPVHCAFHRSHGAGRSVQSLCLSHAHLLQRRNRADRQAPDQPGLEKVGVFYHNDTCGNAGLDGDNLALSA